MEVRPGYKKTKVGVIPEEWDAKALASLGSFSKGQGIRKNEAASGDIPCIRYGEIYTHHNDILRIYNSHISRGVAQTSKRLAKGDILFAGSGETKEEIGKSVAYVGDDEAYAGGDIVILCPHSESSEFLGYLLNSPVIARQKASKGQGDAVVHISASALGSVVIPLPPVPEQRAIAMALSDVDSLLDGLDRCIAKKRNLKQAAMQQLLTGQTRLPGLHGEWEVKTLGKLFDLSAGKSKTAFVTDEGDYWVCDMGSVSTEGKLVVSKRTNYRGEFLEEGDLVMPKDDIGGGKIIGKVGYADANGLYVLGDHVYRLRAREGDSRFLAYMINSHRTNSELRRKVIGSAQLGLGRSSVEEQEVTVPQLAEQTAIADLLSDMDAELAALKARRDKTRDLKQAIMQELLTGKTRLVPAGGAHG